MSRCNRYQCYPVSSPCPILEEVGLPCLQLSWPLTLRGPRSTEWELTVPCVKTFLLLLPFFWCYSAGVNAAGRNVEKVFANKKAEEEQETVELTVLSN